MKKLVVIGNLNVGLASLRELRAAPDCEIALVISHPKLVGFGSLIQRFCGEHKIDYLETTAPNSEPVLERLRAIAPDYLFSIYNPNILKEDLLDIPKISINFHAAPLPRYRGTNTFSWAIFNGDADYGVAWHVIERSIDTGAIVSQRMFPLTGTETALSLCQKSFDVGVALLREEIVPRLATGLPTVVQANGPSTYYGLKDLPPGGGRVDFNWPFDRLERFVRGLSYETAPNPYVYAVAGAGNSVFHPVAVERGPDLPAARSPGRIEAIADDAISIQCGDCIVRVTGALDARKRRTQMVKLCEQLGFKVGTLLGSDPQSPLGA